MPVIDMGALLRPPFAESQFIATKWEDAAGKAHFANTLPLYRRRLQTKSVYEKIVWATEPHIWSHRSF
jgi:hypothetical protein